MDDKSFKSYSDTYLFQKYPRYQKMLFEAMMRDPVIEKNTDEFKDVIYEISRSKVLSKSLERVLMSTNTILLDCVEPLPRVFKVFCSRDPRNRNSGVKVFIDCTNVITKRAKSAEYSIDDIKLISYLINASVCMIYHKNVTILTRNSTIVKNLAVCFSKLFTYIIDYLAKVSIQESNKIKVMYLAATYFLVGILQMENNARTKTLATKIAGISEREADMLDILVDKAARPKSGSHATVEPYSDIRIFVNTLADVLHLDKRVISTDIIVEKWMQQFGPGTVFGLEYLPALSAMLTDAYSGGYLNQQKTIEKICADTMVEYYKSLFTMLDSTI